jgi:phage-related tail fiber protein
MTTLNAAIAYAASAPTFAPGTVVASMAVSITGTVAANNQTVTVAAGAILAQFLNVAADTYTVSAQAQDSNGNPLGTAATTTIAVTAPANISLSLPSTLTVTQS